MANLYIRLTSTFLQRIKKHNPKHGNWKRDGLIFFSFLNGLNLSVISMWLDIAGIKNIPVLQMALTSINVVDKFLSFAVEFMTIPLVVNYFYLFRKKRYQLIIEKSPSDDKRILVVYLIVTMASTLLTFYLYGILGVKADVLILF